jgi:hypothetical protein
MIQIQKDIFDLIRKKLPRNQILANVISEILDIRPDSSYRRIRGEKELTISELAILCKHYDISVDSILGKQNNNVIFTYNPLELSNLENYRRYIKQFTERVSLLSNSETKEIYYTAGDIPIFHFLRFHELAFFKVYVWYKAISDDSIKFERFMEQINDREDLFNDYDRLEDSYFKIPSYEIWTNSTIDPMLRLLEYNYDIGAFDSKQTLILLFGQLNEIIEQVIEWSESGKKNGMSDFKLYCSAIDLENSFMILKNNEKISTTIKLFTINSITTSDPSFCEETEKWIKNTVSKASLLSEISERERIAFFKTLQTKINDLREKLLKQ